MRNKRNPDIKTLYKEGTVEFELEYLRRMCYNAEYQLGLPRDSIAMEEAYTTYAIKIMDGKIGKLSHRNVAHEIVHNVQRKPMLSFCDLPDYYEPVSYDEPERENNPYTLTIIEKLREMRGEEIYEKALWYYRNVGNEIGCNLGKGRNREREKMGIKIRGYVGRLLTRLKRDPDLNEFFSKNLELARNYDFI